MLDSRASLRSVVTIGAYDGVHLGHRRVIETVRLEARELGLRSVVVTFDRHPASVVRPESAPKLLTDLTQKLELLVSLGVDDVEVIHFDEDRAAETAEDFVSQVLVDQLAARLVVVGQDFHFGKGRGGNVALLEEMGRRFSFEVLPFQLVQDEAKHEAVSSTRIRALVAAGALEEAAALLGRPHEVRATVLRVAKQGGASGGGWEADVEVPGEILLPPSGNWVAAAGGERAVAAVPAQETGAPDDPRDPRAMKLSATGPPPAADSTVRIALLGPAEGAARLAIGGQES